MKKLHVLVALAGFSMGGWAAGPDKALFVILGGYNSCENSSRSDLPPLGIGMAPGFSKVLKTAQTKNRARTFQYIIGCLEDSPPPSGEGLFVHSRDAKKLLYGDTKQILKEVEAIAKAEPGTAVFVAGHSYGGWMSMYLASQFSKDVNLQGLFTLDPISPACGPAEVVFGDDACHQAPRDLDNKKIKAKTAAWVNFYQTDDSWLTSSSIGEAENHHVNSSWGPHGDLDSDSKVWKRVEDVVLKALP